MPDHNVMGSQCLFNYISIVLDPVHDERVQSTYKRMQTTYASDSIAISSPDVCAQKWNDERERKQQK